MGGFVALKTALMFPERVRALVLLDGGWPRVESTPEEMTEEENRRPPRWRRAWRGPSSAWT